jgi:hypothetical protein
MLVELNCELGDFFGDYGDYNFFCGLVGVTGFEPATTRPPDVVKPRLERNVSSCVNSLRKQMRSFEWVDKII